MKPLLVFGALKECIHFFETPGIFDKLPMHHKEILLEDFNTKAVLEYICKLIIENDRLAA